MLDVTALILTGIDGVYPGQAKLTFAMARHAAVDLAQVVNAKYDSGAPDRLTDADLDGLREALSNVGLQLRSDQPARDKLNRLRSMYEPYVDATSRKLMMTIPPWRHPEKTRDNWQAGPWDRIVQARGLAILGQKPQKALAQPGAVEDHF